MKIRYKVHGMLVKYANLRHRIGAKSTRHTILFGVPVPRKVAEYLLGVAL